MSPTQTGMAIAAVLVIVWITAGFGAFILVALAIGLGALIGRYVSGDLDIASIRSAVSGKRSSS